MAKNKELSKADKLYLGSNRSIDPKELSKDVNVVLKVVRDFLAKVPEYVEDEVEEFRKELEKEEPEKRDVNKQDEDIVVKKEVNPQRQTKDLYARHKTRKGIVVSTPAASEAADQTRHHRINKGTQTEGVIHRCLDKG